MMRPPLFTLTNSNGSALIIYHCPFCGGAAPKSKRDELFERVPLAENDRLSSLLAGLTTIGAITKKLGNPDYDGHSQSIDRETETRGQILRQHRYLRYERLSDSAYLIVSENPDGTVTWYLQGRPKNSFDWSEVPRKLHPDYRPWWKKLVLWAIGESHRTKP